MYGKVRRAVVGGDEDCEVSVILADDDRVADLNRQWRGKQGPTNVLSFPSPEPPAGICGKVRNLGDIILAGGVVARECAGAQSSPSGTSPLQTTWPTRLA